MPKFLETKKQREDLVFGTLSTAACIGFLFGLLNLVSLIAWSCTLGTSKYPGWGDRVGYWGAFWDICKWALVGLVGLAIVVAVICGITWLVTHWINAGAEKPQSEVEAEIVREAVSRV